MPIVSSLWVAGIPMESDSYFNLIIMDATGITYTFHQVWLALARRVPQLESLLLSFLLSPL